MHLTSNVPVVPMPVKRTKALSTSQTNKVTETILELVAHVPRTKERASAKPVEEARAIAGKVAVRAALTAGGLALPAGPLGWLTILPEMCLVWKLQAQMVADIAGLFGKDATLTQEQMLFCLFKHTTAQAMRDLIVRAGERFLVNRATSRALQMIAKQVGIKITQRAAGKGLARLVPVLGALGVGAYAYFDTGQVASTAIDLFSRDIEVSCN